MLVGVGALPPEAVADAVVWLAADGGADVTGQAIVVDAGHTTMNGFKHSPVAAPGTAAP